MWNSFAIFAEGPTGIQSIIEQSRKYHWRSFLSTCGKYHLPVAGTASEHIWLSDSYVERPLSGVNSEVAGVATVTIRPDPDLKAALHWFHQHILLNR